MSASIEVSESLVFSMPGGCGMPEAIVFMADGERKYASEKEVTHHPGIYRCSCLLYCG